jgi:L-arabinose isomerase
MISPSPKHPLRIGLVGIGLEAYWPQFEGLKARLEDYLGITQCRLQQDGIEVINLGMIDNADKSFAAGRRCRSENIDVIFLHVTTYALSGIILPLVQRAGVPVIILNLQPEAAIDYAAINRMKNRTRMTGEWLAFCAACPVPELANVFRRCGVSFMQITGTLDAADPCWAEVAEWLDAARVAHRMAHNRLGLMGHYYGGMLDIYTDVTGQLATFGGFIELLEVEELAALRRDVSEGEARSRAKEFEDFFEVQADCAEVELLRAARTSVALDRLAGKYQLGSMAYYHKGSGIAENEDLLSSIILGTSLLTARGIPVAGEYEVKNAQAMKIMDTFGAGGSFTEYYAADFRDDVVLMGHDGPGHLAIAEGKTKVRPLEVYHGKVGSGLSVEMSVRHGPVTLLSVVEEKGGLKLLVAEGESVPGPILEIGNTNSRYRFPIGAKRFIENWNAEGPAHHCAVGVGSVASRIAKLGQLLKIPVVRIC